MSETKATKAGKKRGHRPTKVKNTETRGGMSRIYTRPGSAPALHFPVMEPLRFGMVDKNGSCVTVRTPNTPSFARVTL